MSRTEAMNSGVCTVSVDVQDHYLLIRVTTVFLASRDLHARRHEQTAYFTDPGRAIGEVAEFLREYHSRGKFAAGEEIQ
jgi:hypothetical protein